MTPEQKINKHARTLAALLGARHFRSAEPAAIAKTATRDATLAEIKAGTRGPLTRAAEVKGFDIEKRTVELAFSSETDTVERWFGIEILSHEPGACDLTQLNAGGALLVNHDTRDQVGVIESATVDADRRGRAVVRFGKSERANEIFQDVVDGIRRHVSVGYSVLEAKLTEERDTVDVWTITKWTPFEVSIVPVPADTTVGIGRSATPATPVAIPVISIQIPTPRSSPKMTEEEIRAAAAAKALEIEAAAKAAGNAERARSTAILAIGAAYGADELARQFAGNGGTAADLQAAILERNAKASTALPLSADIGMTASEADSYSFMRAVRALANPNDKSAQQAAGFEFEASSVAAKRYGKSPAGLIVPQDVLTRAAVSKAGSGGNLIATNLLPGSFIDLLRNRCVLMGLATPLTGLVGEVDISRQATGGGGYWVGEASDVGENTPTFDKVSLTAKTVGAFTDVTRKMLMQSTPDAEGLLRLDIAKAQAQTIDTAGFYGTGGAQPTGIANVVGINTVDFAVDGAPTYAELVDMESQVAAANADIGSMQYLMHSLTRGKLKTTQVFPGTSNGTPVFAKNEVNGYAAQATNQVLASDVFFGNYADMLLGMWGGLELTVDNITLGKSGGVRIIALQDIDLAVRRAKSFTLGKLAP